MYRIYLRFKSWILSETYNGSVFVTDYDLVRRWLQECRCDSLAMTNLHRIIYRLCGDLSDALATDEQVIDKIAWLVSRGRLFVYKVPQEILSTGGVISHITPPSSQTSGFSAQAPSTQSSPPNTNRIRTSTTPSSNKLSTTTQVSTLSSQTDISEQVQVLKEAAQTGKPFCEECEKVKQAA